MNVEQYAGDDQPFAAFMKKVDAIVSRVSGMSFLDFADADWRGLYDDLGEDYGDDDDLEEAVCETLGDADMIFAEMYALHLEDA